MGAIRATTSVAVAVFGLVLGLGVGSVPSDAGDRETAKNPAGRGGVLPGMSSDVVLVPCGDNEPSDALCGTVRVPLDKRRPGLGSITIAFDLRPHLDQSKPSAGTLVVPNPLGDGLSASYALDGVLTTEHYGRAHDTWDLLYVDDRGSGRSTNVVCPTLQHFDGSRGELAQTVSACGAKLGPLANRLGAAYIADDLEAVRLALGLGKIDLAGVEATTITMDAYASRYPDSVRSLTVESPSAPHYRTDPWLRMRSARLSASAVATCQSGPMCRSARQDVAGALSVLAHRLSAHPVVATGYDDAGNGKRVRIDEQALIRILQDTSGSYINQGEAGAAAAAWTKRHDAVPLARLAAVSAAGLPRNPAIDEKPAKVNLAATYARLCTDYALPFDRSSSPAKRRAEYAQAVRRLAPDTFAPFTLDTWLRVMDKSQYCAGWSTAPGWRPPVPRGAKFPAIPVLVVVSNAGTLSGPDLGRVITRQYPTAHLVVQLMGDGGPINQCGDLMRDWLIELDGGAVSCPDAGARESMGVFPRYVMQQLPIAHPVRESDDESTVWDRKLAAMSVAVARDWLIHSERPGTESGRGLRGGTWEITGGTEDTADVTFDQVRWTRDVTMSGKFHLRPFDGTTLSWIADFEVVGRHGLHGTVHIETSHQFEHDATAMVTGVIDGRTVSVLAPAL